MNKTNKIVFVVLLGCILLLLILAYKKINNASGVHQTTAVVTDITTSTTATSTSAFTDADWKRVLTPEQYYILRQAGTEVPFSSPLDYETRPGTYVTADCHEPVFRSEQKYDSGTGWPSFWAPIKPDAVVLASDNSLLMQRTEVVSKCGGHLGHVFDDGPAPTGKRYCMNGDALIFIPDATTTAASRIDD